ncbi:MAG: hypothetical protein KF773_26290 [Deltaproteobacteria bacterium]|nr:hypothetical protein [Deltaproteobacteria bacterium]MCW5805402.1 hypothetical protein [Deltaproteobacteria bacterium]
MVVGGCAYRPGSFHSEGDWFRGSIATVECLDVAIERSPDLSDGSPVVGYTFGNRCNQPAIVDLSGATVVGHADDGSVVPLTAKDPFGELRPLYLDARATGHESISYAVAGEVTSVCVDVNAVARTFGNARWLCVAGRTP